MNLNPNDYNVLQPPHSIYTTQSRPAKVEKKALAHRQAVGDAAIDSTDNGMGLSVVLVCRIPNTRVVLPIWFGGR